MVYDINGGQFKDTVPNPDDVTNFNENIGVDPTKIPEIENEIKEGKKDPISVRYATFIREKMYGSDVRESMARFVLWISVLYNRLFSRQEDVEIRQTSVENRQNSLEKRYNDQIAGNTDINEIIDARRPLDRDAFATLGLRLDKQFSEKVEVEKTMFRNSKDNEGVILGDELTTSIGWVSSGWSGEVTSGFTHTPGNTNPLILNIPSLKTNTPYTISLEITNVGQLDGISDIYVQLGGTEVFETYKGKHSKTTLSSGFSPLGINKQLVITPRSDWSGTISNISVKEIVRVSLPTQTFRDASNEQTLEIRVGAAPTDNTFIGKNAGRFTHEGYQNTVYGNNSMKDNIGGFWNASFGDNTLMSNINGSRNVAGGFQALMDAISTDRCVALGTFSARRLKYGTGNITIGADSGWFMEKANHVIAIGTVALGSNTSPNNIIALGERVMSSSEGGTHVFAAGRLAGNYNKGDNGIFIGNMAAYHNREGLNNIALGNQALQMNREGSDSIAMGRSALNKSTEGDNIALGFLAAQNLEKGKHNFVAGREALNMSPETSYAIAIGFNSQKMNKNVRGENISLGRESLARGEQAERSIAIGPKSLIESSGDRTVAIGASSGLVHKTGLGNVFIGASSAFNHEKGDNNIIIGFNTRTERTDSSNYLNIGGVITSKMDTKIVEMPKLMLTDLPTTKPSLAGQVWNDGGTLKVA